ncbi:acyltransferase [Mitsuaria sp. BK037]|uniref:acyltransferase family protein n=1 Tax=Mitsuaria sp. BK037 TaxID=2587122 RepID=UPI0016075FDA|nr:acyltransferase family protein [Mitsuaria sp. BK037]MBB3283594.1 peptidoglycan/LPS O-acetylase OafA/YrhL [Mitsuaria sp. BK037]
MASRLFPLDALRATAAQLIVLHHLSVYGPIAEAMHRLFPLLTGWLYDYGRMAVQVFLVLGGYLSARALAAQEPQLRRSAPALLAQRYWRLVPPFMAAVGLTLLSSWLVAPLLPDLVPEQVELAQILAHALLLQDLLPVEALTVGAWYVAIDFQLFALLLLVMWGLRCLPLPGARRQELALALVGALCAASLLQFNRMAELDVCAIYFFGAYGLGVLLCWCQGWTPRARRAGLLALGGLMAVALALEFRERLVVAALTAAVIALWHRGTLPAWFQRHGQAPVQTLARHAYALFLVHFPVCLLVNAIYEHRAESPALMLDALAPLALLAAWLLSNMAAVPFHRWIEAPLLRWRPRAAALPQGVALR